MKYVIMLVVLMGCVTVQPTDTVIDVHGCDKDPDFNSEWCVVILSDGSPAIVPSWDIKEGDTVTCELRGALTCFKKD